ncbi:MAG: NAD(P)H-dependent oxidoreductase [Elusimicrobiota bacterium]|nr:NAD(P)H-dependent oxidoreductase [Elusimicrobiota bacterium]MDH5662070.1 NAD(P)H-dependent oxidoreductase [Elusimicrobiota bacterium]
MKNLILYYSRTGKTRFLAEKLKEELGGDLVEIRDLRKRKGPFGFLRGVRDAHLGLNTEVAPLDLDLSKYELIMIGTPVWSYSPTPALNTFLQTSNLVDKKVIIFVTSRGAGYRRAIDILKGKVEEKGGKVIGVGSVKTWLKGKKCLSKAGVELAKLWKTEIKKYL